MSRYIPHILVGSTLVGSATAYNFRFHLYRKLADRNIIRLHSVEPLRLDEKNSIVPHHGCLAERTEYRFGNTIVYIYEKIENVNGVIYGFAKNDRSNHDGYRYMKYEPNPATSGLMNFFNKDFTWVMHDTDKHGNHFVVAYSRAGDPLDTITHTTNLRNSEGKTTIESGTFINDAHTVHYDHLKKKMVSSAFPHEFKIDEEIIKLDLVGSSMIFTEKSGFKSIGNISTRFDFADGKKTEFHSGKNYGAHRLIDDHIVKCGDSVYDLTNLPSISYME